MRFSSGGGLLISGQEGKGSCQAMFDCHKGPVSGGLTSARLGRVERGEYTPARRTDDTLPSKHPNAHTYMYTYPYVFVYIFNKVRFLPPRDDIKIA